MRRLAVVVSLLMWFCILNLLSGCVKRIHTAGGTDIEFATGFDVGASANAVDTVDNNRGIKPGAGYSARGAKY